MEEGSGGMVLCFNLLGGDIKLLKIFRSSPKVDMRRRKDALPLILMVQTLPFLATCSSSCSSSWPSCRILSFDERFIVMLPKWFVPGDDVTGLTVDFFVLLG